MTKTFEQRAVIRSVVDYARINEGIQPSLLKRIIVLEGSEGGGSAPDEDPRSEQTNKNSLVCSNCVLSLTVSSSACFLVKLGSG